MKHTQADNEINEERLLNLLVNNIEEKFAIDLGERVKVTVEKLYEVLAGETLINHVCETTDDPSHANTVRGYLTGQFGVDTVEAVRDSHLQRDGLETLPD